MNFLLKDYIATLKEDKELDAFVSELLFSMDIVSLSKPQRGRQNGVDISAVGIDPEDGIKKVFLMAVKQGDFTRLAWDNGLNAIRPTLNSIIDVYIPTFIPAKYKDLPVKIVVCTNGELSQTVHQTWVQFTNTNSIDGKREFDFWGIDHLIQKFNTYFVPENFFSKEDKLLLRKTLASIDLPDYDLRHFFELIDSILKPRHKNKKGTVKKLRLISICFAIAYKWASENNNLKPLVLISERILLKTWEWLKKNDLLQERFAMQEFFKMHEVKLQIGRLYFIKIQKHCYVKDALFSYAGNSVEYAILTWEQIGIISTLGLMEVFQKRVDQRDKDSIEQSLKAISDGLIHLIENNPPATQPKYDEHCIEINLALLLLINTNNEEYATKWLKDIVRNIYEAYKINKFFPLYKTSHDRLVNAEITGESEVPTSSILLTVLAEWACLFENDELYQRIRKMLSETFKDVNLQMWLPEKESEDDFYSKNVMGTGSILHSIELPEKFADYKKRMVYELTAFGVEKDMSFVTSGVDYLAFLSARHYRTYLFPIFWRVLIPKEKS